MPEEKICESCRGEGDFCRECDETPSACDCFEAVYEPCTVCNGAGTIEIRED